LELGGLVADVPESTSGDYSLSKEKQLATIRALKETIALRHTKQRRAMEDDCDTQQAALASELTKLARNDMVNNILRDQEKLCAELQLSTDKVQEAREVRLVSLKAEAAKRAAMRHQAAEDNIASVGQQPADAAIGPAKSLEELEAELTERFAQEEALLVAKMEAEASAKEQEIADKITQQKKLLRERNAEKLEEAMGKQKAALSASDTAKLVETFGAELKEQEEKLEAHKALQTSSVKQKLATRQRAKTMRLKKQQANEQLQQEMDHKQNEKEEEFKKIKEAETVQLEDQAQAKADANVEGGGGGGVVASDMVIASVLQERHTKELAELEGRKEDQQKVAVSQAELAVDDELDQEIEAAQARQDEAMAALMANPKGMDEAKLEKKRKSRAKKHAAELDAVRKGFAAAREDAIQMAIAEADSKYAEDMIVLRDRHYDEIHETLERFGAEEQGGKDAKAATLTQVENKRKQLEKESLAQEQQLERERTQFEEEQKKQMEDELKQFEDEAEAERLREQELAEKKTQLTEEAEREVRGAAKDAPSCGESCHGECHRERRQADDRGHRVVHYEGPESPRRRERPAEGDHDGQNPGEEAPQKAAQCHRHGYR